MILETDFTVGAPPDRVLLALLDLEALGACLPGASLRPIDGDSTTQGTLRPRIAGSEVECVGTLRAVDVDEDGRSASAALRVRQVGGPAFATALLRGRLDEADDGTRVAVSVEGRLAAPGVSEDESRPEAERLLGELAASLQSSLTDRAARPAPEAPAPEPAPAAAPAPERPPVAAPAKEKRRALPVPPAAAVGAVGAAGAVVAVALLRGKRWRPAAWVEIRYRW
jgi:carbon monoxide dehydrogenase subunit G